MWNGTQLHHFINGKKGKSHAKPGKSVKPTQSTFKTGRRERGGNPLNLWRINWWGPYIDVRYDLDYEAPKIAFAPDDNTVYLLYLDEDNIDGDSFNNFGKIDPNATLAGAGELVEAKLPNTERRVPAAEPANKLGTP